MLILWEMLGSVLLIVLGDFNFIFYSTFFQQLQLYILYFHLNKISSLQLLIKFAIKSLNKFCASVEYFNWGEQLKGDSRVVNDVYQYKRSLLYHLVQQMWVDDPMCSVASVAEDC